MAKEFPRTIDLTGRDLVDEQLLALIDDGLFAQDVGMLELDGNQLTAKSLMALARSPMSYVRALSASANPLGDEAGEILARELVFWGLKSLVLSNTGLTSQAIVSLVGPTSRLTGPFWLVLDDNPIGDVGAEVIASSTRCRFLQTLSLSNTGLTDLGALALAESSCLKKLSHLGLAGNPIGERGLETLRNAPGLRRCIVDLGAPA